MNIYILIYIVSVSLLAMIMTVRDKIAARQHTRRIRERTLLTVSVLGGSAAMLLTMLVIRHKTRHAKFMFGIPLILMLQIAAVVLAFHVDLPVF